MLPSSDMYPALSLQLINGFKLGVSNQGKTDIDVELHIENIGKAADESVLKTIEKKLLQEDLDVVFSFCSHALLEQMVNIFQAFKKPLVHIDLGGNLLQEAQVNPNVVHHHLGLCSGAYAAGVYVAKNLGESALVASSFYDGGYQIHIGFQQGFLDAGGKHVSYYVSPQ